MSARALEFVETWVSEKIEAMETLPAAGDVALWEGHWRTNAFKPRWTKDIPAAEI